MNKQTVSCVGFNKKWLFNLYSTRTEVYQALVSSLLFILARLFVILYELCF